MIIKIRMNKRLHFVRTVIILSLMLFAGRISYSQPNGPITLSEFFSEVYKPKYMLNVNGGLGYLIANARESKEQLSGFEISRKEINKYYNFLRPGGTAGASMHYLLKTNLGIGLDYHLFTTGNKVMGYLNPGDGWTKFYGPFSEKIHTNFWGISMYYSRPINKKWFYYGKLSGGWAFYKNQAQVIVPRFRIKGNAPAIFGESGVTYKLNKNFSFNMGFSDFFSVINKIDVYDGEITNNLVLEGKNKENLMRLNLTAGVQLHFIAIGR